VKTRPEGSQVYFPAAAVLNTIRLQSIPLLLIKWLINTRVHVHLRPPIVWWSLYDVHLIGMVALQRGLFIIFLTLPTTYCVRIACVLNISTMTNTICVPWKPLTEGTTIIFLQNTKVGRPRVEGLDMFEVPKKMGTLSLWIL